MSDRRKRIEILIYGCMMHSSPDVVGRLLLLSSLKDIEEYCYKHYRYKHYKDKNKYGIWDCNYNPPLANKRKVMFDNIDKAIKFDVNTGKDTILQYLLKNY